MSGAELIQEFEGVDFDSRDAVDVLAHFDRLLATGRKVVTIPFQGSHAYAVLGHEAVQAAFMDELELPGATYFRRFTMEFFGHVVSAMEGDEHRFHRAVFGGPLTPVQVRQRVQSILVPAANELISGLEPNRRFDFVERFARPYPFNVISILLGVPVEDRAHLHEYVERSFDIARPEEAMWARDGLAQYLEGLVASRLTSPGDDIVTKFATAEVGGKRYSRQELLDAIRFIYPAAAENTRNALSAALYHVLQDPEVLRRVRDNPADRDAAVEEALRIEPPLSVMLRYTERPLTLEGVAIPAESFVLLCIATANRDPLVFENPTAFSLDRGPLNHVTFGRGPHFCLGAHLARAEVRTMLDLALSRLKGLRIAKGEHPVAVGGTQHGFQELGLEFDELSPPASQASA